MAENLYNRGGSNDGDGPDRASTSGAEALIGFAKAHDIDYIFCSPIAVMAPLWEAFAAKAIDDGGVETTPRYRNCRHELLAVGLAHGYARVTGKPQIVFLPTGLGVLNGAMGLRSTLQERTPMLVLSPDTITYGTDKTCDPGCEWPSLLVDHHGPAAYGQLATKWAREIKMPHELVPELRRALYFADSIPRGPVLLQIPFEFLKNPVPVPREQAFTGSVTVASDADLDKVVKLLVNARAPLVITEHAARSNDQGAKAKFLSFVEELGAPVFEFINPTTESFPRSHPLYAPTAVEAHLGEADLIVVAGSNAPWHPPHPESLPDDCVVVVVDEDPLRPRAPFWGYRSDAALAGDICENLELLTDKLKAIRARGEAPPRNAAHVALWTERNAATRSAKRTAAKNARQKDCVHSSQLYSAMNRLLPAGSAVVDEIIASLPLLIEGMFSAVGEGEPQKDFLHVRGWAGALGTGIPVALGCKLALGPERAVCCFVGDGAFHYTPIPACFGFCQQYAVPILIVVCNNRGFVSQSWNIHKYYPHGAAVTSNTLLGPDITPTPAYATLAAAYGGHGETVADASQLDAAIGRCLAAMKAGRFAVLDVLCEP